MLHVRQGWGFGERSGLAIDEFCNKRVLTANNVFLFLPVIDLRKSLIKRFKNFVEQNWKSSILQKKSYRNFSRINYRRTIGNSDNVQDYLFKSQRIFPLDFCRSVCATLPTSTTIISIDHLSINKPYRAISTRK